MQQINACQHFGKVEPVRDCRITGNRAIIQNGFAPYLGIVADIFDTDRITYGCDWLTVLYQQMPDIVQDNFYLLQKKNKTIFLDKMLLIFII